MSNSRLDNTTAINEGKELNKHQSDEDLLTKTHKMQAEGATLIEKEDLNQAKNIDLDRTSEIVEALEQELSERKKQIVTSFQLQELSHSSRAQRRSSVKSNIVIWTRAEQQ
jgi:phosphoribosylformimino-5-aminoimidazole carboxamide ribonucleotide (ProFAR) isomerase